MLFRSRLHVGWDLLKRLAGRAIYGQDDSGEPLVLPLDWCSGERPCACGACFQAKSRVKRGLRSRTQYTEPGHVAVDMFDVGGTGTATLGGKRYATLFVDLATRHVKVYLHKRKIDRLRMFRHYVAFAASHGVTIKSFRTDPAREYLCTSLHKYFDARGIQIGRAHV